MGCNPAGGKTVTATRPEMEIPFSLAHTENVSRVAKRRPTALRLKPDARVARPPLARAALRVRACPEQGRNPGAARPQPGSRAAACDPGRRRAPPTRPRAGDRPVERRRHRARRARPLRRGARRRPRAREAAGSADGGVAGSGPDGGTARAVRGVAGARERLPARRVRARSRSGGESGSRSPRPPGLAASRLAARATPISA